MDEIVDRIIAGLSDMLESIMPGSPTPPAPRGVDAWDHACQSRSKSDLATSAAASAVEALTRMYAPAADWWDAGAIEIGLFEASDPLRAGHTSRHTDPGFDFHIELNQNRWIRSYFDMAISLIHELAHVDHVRRAGFLPHEVVTLADDEDEFVALGWQFELRAFEAMLAGARAIYHSDKDRYRPCWDVSVTTDAILTPLNDGNLALARREIKDAYPEAEARGYWAANHAGPAPSGEIVAVWTVFYGFGQNDDPSIWGL